MEKLELQIAIDSPPIRNSFNNESMKGERRARIEKCTTYCHETLTEIHFLLNEKELSAGKLKIMSGKLLKAILLVLELRMSEKSFQQYGKSVLDGKERSKQKFE